MDYPKSYIKKIEATDKINEPLTQDELVELCKSLPKYQKKTYLQLLSNMRIGIQQLCCTSYLEQQTLNELWLIFYMHEAFGLKWYDGKNEWK